MKEKLKFRGPLKQYMRTPMYLAILLLGLNILVYMVNIRAGLFSIPGTGCVLTDRSADLYSPQANDSQRPGCIYHTDAMPWRNVC